MSDLKTLAVDGLNALICTGIAIVLLHVVGFAAFVTFLADRFWFLPGYRLVFFPALGIAVFFAIRSVRRRKSAILPIGIGAVAGFVAGLAGILIAPLLVKFSITEYVKSLEFGGLEYLAMGVAYSFFLGGWLYGALGAALAILSSLLNDRRVQVQNSEQKA